MKGSGDAGEEDLDCGSCFRAQMTKIHTVCKWGRGWASSPSWYQPPSVAWEATAEQQGWPCPTVWVGRGDESDVVLSNGL